MTIQNYDFSTKSFYANSAWPKLATMRETEFEKGDKLRTIRVGDVCLDATIADKCKSKNAHSRGFYFPVDTSLGDIHGTVDKSIVYSNKDGIHTVIVKGFQSDEFKKGNYAYLKRTLPDGDVIELTMKQAKNGKYEPVVIKSAQNKLLSDLPNVKEMLLRLDPLVKRFIKVAK